MANLSDLPEELLSQICGHTELDSLILLALSSKIFNRIAGNLYLRRAWPQSFKSDHRFRYHDRLDVSDSIQYEDKIPFSTLSNVTSVLGSMSNVAHVSFTFSESGIEALQQMRLVVLTLRAIHSLFSMTLIFPENGGSQEEAIAHYIPSAKPLKIYSMKSIALDAAPSQLKAQCLKSRFITSQPRWMPKFFNSFSRVPSIIVHCSKEWTDILPQLHLPSLRTFSFRGSILDAQTSNIEVLAAFLNRHQALVSLSCGQQFAVSSLSARCQLLPSNITDLSATVPQPCYLLSSKAFSPQTIDIQFEKCSSPLPFSETDQLWNLLSLISSHLTIRKLKLPADSPILQEVLFSSGRNSYRFPHITWLEVKKFQSLADIAKEGFIPWACEMFPCTQTLHVQRLNWDSRSFAQSVVDNWPSVRILMFDYKTQNVEAWHLKHCLLVFSVING
ncbi:hypothetical protein BT96DRAFT_1016193 [Gymnopus androsaceus JB14]|uniref:F-box domain-containing protein n=1 Tax=Gymnopus androsaceus JB14 TaxID=1447944 RepID=A0A6A4I6B5_9AGAR|nr:hypothetical protein BT96DRAFT_1016193 [Gymnopus androsaceus JB14]